MGETVAPWRTRLSVAAVIVLLVIVVYVCARQIIAIKDRFVHSTVAIKSPVDGMSYEVFDNYKDAAEAADTLARINGRVVASQRHLKDKYIRNVSPESTPARLSAVHHLLARYNPDNLAENSPFDIDSAFSQDKGALVRLCLRSRKPRPGKAGAGVTSYSDGAVEPLNVLTFVTVHEMAHVAIDDLDHPRKFWETFKFLLQEAEEAGVCKFPDYGKYPVSYCGLSINYNPLFDPSTAAI